MTTYCLESGTEEFTSAIVHELDCSSYDLGSLLGAGLLVSLGEFEDSTVALNSVRANHPYAVRCINCCKSAIVVPLHGQGRKLLNLVA
ncbi:MAG: hypothetical protein RLZZ227_915 [Pseudomonadota bacterium]|jgi:hypothetical protein